MQLKLVFIDALAKNYEFLINLAMDDAMHSSSVSIFSSQVNALYKY